MPTDPISLTAAKPRRAACPVCGRPPEPQFKPFCSKRCADVDLARWLNGVYRVPVVDREGDDDLDPAAETDAKP